jgi:hypothetical protein
MKGLSFHQKICLEDHVTEIAPKISCMFHGWVLFCFLDARIDTLWYTVFMRRPALFEGYWIVHLLLCTQ